MKNIKSNCTIRTVTCENDIATINIDCIISDKNKDIILDKKIFDKQGKVFCGYEKVIKNMDLQIHIKKEYFDILQNQNFDWLSVVNYKIVEFGANAPENTINIVMSRHQTQRGDIYYTGKGEQLYIQEFELKNIIIEKLIEQYKPLTAKLNNNEPTIYLFGLTQNASIYVNQKDLAMLGYIGGNFKEYTLPAIKFCLDKRTFLIEQPNYYKDFKGFEAIGLYKSSIELKDLEEKDIKKADIDEILKYLEQNCLILNS